MKNLLLLPLLFLHILHASAQLGFNYYKDSVKNGSSNPRAFTYFKKAYYDCIWHWTAAGADSAAYYLQRAIQEDSNYVAAYSFLAHLYQFKTYNPQDFDKYFVLQKKYALKAMSYHPVTGDAFSVMSDVAWTEHDTAQALKLLRDAIAREPDNMGNYLFLSVRYTQMGGRDDSAINCLQTLLHYDPQYGQAYMKLGNVYNWNKHNPDSAKYYYRKAIENYLTIKPRDSRMMGGYNSMADVYYKQAQYDSAACYYKLFLQELEPSDMYVRDQFLSLAYKALYECQQRLSAGYLQKLLLLSRQRIAKDSGNTGLLMEILEQQYMPVAQDSVYKNYALPLAKKLQTMLSGDPYLSAYATDDAFIILKKLGRNPEALQVLNAYHTRHLREPLILLDLARLKISMHDYQAGFNYLNQAKSNLNTVITRQIFTDMLNHPDFDNVRNAAAFKKLAAQ